MRKLFLRKQRALIIGGVLIAILSFPLWVGYDSHSTSVNFQEYAPASLPAHTNIMAHSLDIWAEPGNFIGHKKILTLQLNNSHSFISEDKNIDFRYACDEHITNQACVIAETPKHQRYELTTTYDQTNTSKPFGQTVDLVKGGTHIWITVQGNPLHMSSQATWSKLIDSFAPVHYGSITIRHYSPSP